MNQQEQDFLEEKEEEAYRPRPRWQVWGARLALVIFIALIIMSYVNIARGGL